MKPSKIFKEKINDVIQIAEKYKKDGIYNLRLFGSVARGDDNENSDIDFLVNIDMNKKNKMFVYAMEAELEDILGMKVELIPEEYCFDSFKEEIAREVVCFMGGNSLKPQEA